MYTFLIQNQRTLQLTVVMKDPRSVFLFHLFSTSVFHGDFLALYEDYLQRRRNRKRF